MIAYNEEKLVARAIQSVLNQTERNIELYVRNNGSKDRTGEVVREIAGRDSRVHLVENPVNWRKGPAGEEPFINAKGAIDIWPIDRETLGDYVAFLDADDRLQPTFTEELLRAAETNRAEIAVCGNIFMQDGVTPVGNRLPPPVQFQTQSQWGPALRDGATFAQLYNVFRTYWGKLFRRDFFLRHYDEAWPPACGAVGFLDTAAMLRYLRRCEHLSCVVKPLYLFTVGSGSSYANFKSESSIIKAVQSEVLFDEGLRFLQKKGAATQENCQFLYQLNWAFCYEAMEGLQRVREATPYDLDRVTVMLNNRVAASYLSSSGDAIWPQLEPILQSVWTKSGQKMELYLRYPIRLMYIRKLMEACPDSALLPVLLLGVLCDPENKNLLGTELLPEIAGRFPGLAQVVQYQFHMEWSQRQSSLRNWWAERVQTQDGMDGQAGALAEKLQAAFAEERYEDAGELLSLLCEKSPLHREGIYYRIQLAELIGEHELAAVLAASARIVFGLDIEMQNLCWFIFSQGGEQA